MALTPKVAIISASPVGLTLARLLYVSGVEVKFRLYELDASSISRPEQGGTLDLHIDTRLPFRKCCLWDSFRKDARYEGEELILNDENATKLVYIRGREKQGPFDRPEMDPERLKEILLESVPKECVSCGRHMREVIDIGMLRFDGREEIEGPFDMMLGADGARSKIGERLRGLQPAYSGVSG